MEDDELIENYGAEKIITAVIECGEDRWYQFGLELGIKDGAIASSTADKPTASSKLRKLLEVKAAASTVKTMLKELLKACHKLKIYGAVLDDLRGKGCSGRNIPDSPNVMGVVTKNLVRDPTTSDPRVQAQLAERLNVEILPKLTKAIEGKWKEIANWLAPETFNPDRITVIQREQDTEFMRATSMLQQWRSRYDRQATNKEIISALCNVGLVDKARQIFGQDLVEAVEPRPQQGTQ